MNRREFALAALAGSPGHHFTPVQLQKLIFLLDRNIGSRLGGSGFQFEPYHYGPFDKRVYGVMRLLESQGLVDIREADISSPRNYRLTDAGQQEGAALLATLDSALRDYIVSVGTFVRSLSFAALVSSVYEAYPEMKVNSVFTS